MHIVAIKQNGTINGYQVRVGTGGVGNTKFFASKKHGGSLKAKRAAEQFARDLGLLKAVKPGGSKVGRLLRNNATGAAGIRFVWTPAAAAPVLRVVATWVDKKGRPKNTSYSVESNGLDGALDKAIKARTSAGAPVPDRDALLKRLRKAYRSRASA